MNYADEVKAGRVRDAPDDEHPVATRAQGNPTATYVTREFAANRIGIAHPDHGAPFHDDERTPFRIAMDELDAGEHVTGVSAEYWLPKEE